MILYLIEHGESGTLAPVQWQLGDFVSYRAWRIWNPLAPVQWRLGDFVSYRAWRIWNPLAPVQWQLGDFVSYRAWRIWNPLAPVQGIAIPDCTACLIHLMYYDTFLSPALLPFPILLACGLFIAFFGIRDTFWVPYCTAVLKFCLGEQVIYRLFLSGLSFILLV